ncbi:hypothetical protein Tco_0030989 [Tanacetum coccineum]
MEQHEFLLAPIPMIDEQIYMMSHIEYKEDMREKMFHESPRGTLLHVLGKTKDEVNARLDLAESGVKP